MIQVNTSASSCQVAGPRGTDRHLRLLCQFFHWVTFMCAWCHELSEYVCEGSHVCACSGQSRVLDIFICHTSLETESLTEPETYHFSPVLRVRVPWIPPASSTAHSSQCWGGSQYAQPWFGLVCFYHGCWGFELRPSHLLSRCFYPLLSPVLACPFLVEVCGVSWDALHAVCSTHD